jgi:hypothetical protein
MSSRRWATRLLAVSGAAVALAASAGPAAASSKPIVIGFEKDCPVLTCQETGGSPVNVSTSVTPIAFVGDGRVLHYSATETLSSPSGSVTLSMVGILNFTTDPDFTVLRGTVVSGSWNGIELAGARLRARAVRVVDTVFAGSVAILPSTVG